MTTTYSLIPGLFYRINWEVFSLLWRGLLSAVLPRRKSSCTKKTEAIMVDVENNVSMVTRAAKRKAEASQPQALAQQGTKKRVALGEITNVHVPTDSRRRCVFTKPKQKKAKPAKKNVTPKDRGKNQLPCSRKSLVDSKKEDALVENSEDPQFCPSFAIEIYDYLRKLEVDPKRRPTPNYIESVQKDVTPNMRGILVDWLVEVADEYRLLSETLYLTIYCIDRFLSIMVLNRQKLQLLGVAAMLVASKYEEIKPPNVEDFCYITDNTYTKQEVLKMESDILNALKFELGNPTTKTFLRKLIRIAQKDSTSGGLQLEFLSCYLADLSLLDYNLVKFLPSMVAASVIFLTRYILRPNDFPWNLTLEQHSGYKAVDLRPCVLALHDFYLGRQGEGLSAVREKYKQHKYKWVALTPSPPNIPDFFFDDIDLN